PKVLRSGPSSLGASDRLGRALGWFSVGPGPIELVAPGRITRTLGMEGNEGLVRAYGAREIASGVLSLSVDKQAGLWSRALGDGLDIATVATALRPDNPNRDNAGLALAMLVGIALVDLLGAGGTTVRHSSARRQNHDYRDRSGFPRGVANARGAARDFKAPSDLRAAPSLATVSDRPATISGTPQVM
ncbi:MAG: hypothetical protein JOY66_25870, partial [Acetobacteraceae bacterium]|nr:hypothetical protein [Acetobacteraceae bacterium]